MHLSLIPTNWPNEQLCFGSIRSAKNRLKVLISASVRNVYQCGGSLYIEPLMISFWNLLFIYLSNQHHQGTTIYQLVWLLLTILIFLYQPSRNSVPLFIVRKHHYNIGCQTHTVLSIREKSCKILWLVWHGTESKLAMNIWCELKHASRGERKKLGINLNACKNHWSKWTWLKKC